jgi:hypothetical protein
MRKVILSKEKIKFDVDHQGKKFENNSKPSPTFTDKKLFEMAYKSLAKIPN